MDEATIDAPADRVETMTRRPPEVVRARAYRPDVDGLRSLAVLSVVLYHAGVSQISGGFTGVDVFFVISGYLIGGHINAELTAGIFRFLNFYRNRAKRILPALYVVLTAVLVVGIVLFSPHELRELAIYTISTTASGSNIALWRNTNYFAPSANQNPLLMTWSLGVEEQFYLLIPLLLVLLSRIRHRLILPVIVLISASSFFIACYKVNHWPDSAFYLLDSRAWELGVGVALAMFEAGTRRSETGGSQLASSLRSWMGLGLIVASFFMLNSVVPFPGYSALPSVLGTALLLSSCGGWINRRVLSLSPLVFIGRVSYSFYLIHWPLLAILRILRGGTLPPMLGIVAVLTAFGLAVLSYYFVEIVFRSSKRAAGPLLLRYGAISVVLLFVSGLIFITRGLPWRYPQAAYIDSIISANSSVDHDRCLAQEQETTPRLYGVCTGSKNVSKHIALWGDSHASAVAQEIQATAGRSQLSMETYEKTSCPPLIGLGRDYILKPFAARNCILFNTAVLQRIVNEPQVEIVILEAFWDAPFDPHTGNGKLLAAGTAIHRQPSQAESEQLFRLSLTATLNALVAAGKRVVVLGDTPVFETDPAWRMRTSSIRPRFEIARMMIGDRTLIDPGKEDAFDATDPQRAEWGILRQVASTLPGVTFWDMRKNLCDTQAVCRYREGGDPLFVDTNHVSPKGARKALQGWELLAP